MMDGSRRAVLGHEPTFFEHELDLSNVPDLGSTIPSNIAGIASGCSPQVPP